MTPRPTHTHDTRGTSKRSVESLVSVELTNKVGNSASSVCSHAVTKY